VTPTVLPIDARSAELAKLFCNMYRYIDFAFGNEFMMIAAQHGREIHPDRRRHQPRLQSAAA
jgi:UDP-N-acetyl-D-mannosaminuronic acid dehydrogenase